MGRNKDLVCYRKKQSFRQCAWGLRQLVLKPCFRPKGRAMGMLEKSENLNSLRPIFFELCKKNYKGGGSNWPPPPAGIGLILYRDCKFFFYAFSNTLITIISEGEVTGRGCSTKDKIFHIECENHVMGKHSEKFCYCSYYLCNSADRLTGLSPAGIMLILTSYRILQWSVNSWIMENVHLF